LFIKEQRVCHLHLIPKQQPEGSLDGCRTQAGKEFEFIHKHMGSGRGRNMAMGKLRRVSKELGAGRNYFRIAKAKARFKELRRPDDEWQQMNAEWAAIQASGRHVLQSSDLVVGYDEPLFIADDIKLQRGSCAALIGPNGAGKTTFLRTLLDEVPPIAGTIQLGHGVRIGYFAQAHETLDPAQRVIEAVRNQPRQPNQPPLDDAAARNHLARYLFRGDEVFKPIVVLSGGERGRLALALLALQGANFLLLDEPTNHLDLPAQEVLQAMLEGYDGTILLIAHDRYLVAQLATEIWDLRDGYLTIFHGDYAEFVSHAQEATPKA